VDEARKKDVCDLYRQGVGGHEIARRLKAGKNHVFRVLKEAGLTAGTGKRNKFRPDVEAEIAAKYASGSSLQLLAKEYATSPATVRAVVLRNNGKCRKSGGQFLDPSEDESLAIAAAWHLGVSQQRIAEYFGVAQTVVSRWLAKRGIVKDHKRAKGERHGMYSGKDKLDAPCGYVYARVSRDDPMRSMANSSGYALEHRVVMARHLGRPLRKSETVHHRNDDTKDNRLENLQLRQGNHGKGVCLRCARCGSTDLEPQDL
jgi:hypothetical protein